MEWTMGCKCPGNNKLNTEAPCLDQNEESFRKAYNRMNSSYIQVNAQKAEIEKRLQVTEAKASEYVNSLSQKVIRAETMLFQALTFMDPQTRSHFEDKYGVFSFSNFVA